MKKRAARPRSADVEIAELRARLEEAEDTLEAIRSGQIEALVISTPTGPRVYTLEGADHRYRRLVETMNEGALLVSKAGLVLYANAAFAAMVAAPLEAVSGRHLADFVDPASRAAYEALLAAGATEHDADEITLRSARGLPVAAYLSMSPNDGDDEGEAGVAVIVTNLTAQKRSEEIVASERLASSILEQAAEALVVCDPNGIIVRASQAARELAAGQALRHHVFTAFPLRADGDEEGRLGHPASRALAGEIADSIEMLLDVPGRPPMHVLCSAAPLLSDKKEIRGCVMSLVNITRQKAFAAERAELLEAERAARTAAERARAEAETSNRSKDEFLATVSHELRTPLNSIVGWSRMLAQGTLPRERQKHAIDVIRRNADNQTRLIEDLLDVSRIVSGKMRLDVHSVEPAKVIRAVIESVQPALDAKGITLQKEIDAAEGRIVADESRLQQIVWNLVSNAVKFTPRGGTIRVTLRPGPENVDIIVSDDGQGIDPAFLPFVFDRFQQADGTISRQHGGLGLGLAITRHLVELHGGSISVASERAGRGATFTTRLPRAVAHDALLALPPESGPGSERGGSEALTQLDKLRVLVVEDDDDSRELLVSILTRCGASVTAASNGSEALGLLAAEPEERLPRVIVSDIGMPEMDGYALIRRIRTLPRAEARRIPALALTAYARSEDRRRALAEGFQMHMAKPVNPSELAVSVASLARYTAA
ncbi:MAG: two-component hybrid sensor and regulator [Labilithrix sp.]|nr:two-component hybrid sensor and regulator [Labilithrix sp.]